MIDFSVDQAQKREKTLFAAVLLSIPGPLVTGIAAISSHSSTQLADFIRRSAELLALFVAWWVFRYLQRHTRLSEDNRTRLEQMAGLSVAFAMGCSGLIMLIISISRFSDYAPAGNVISGLVIAFLGLLTNTWFWWRYTMLTREQFNPVIAAQQKLYRAKASVDLCVVIALTVLTLAPNHPVSQYLDILGSCSVAIYLLYSAIDMLRSLKVQSSMNYSTQQSSSY